MIKIYTDGSSRGTGDNKCGGWGVAVVIENGESTILDCRSAQTESETTNNREEIKALLTALDFATELYKDQEVEIYCDSAYCVNMFNEWIHTWAKNNWCNSKGVVAKNIDLVMQLYCYAEIGFPNFAVKKIKGHNGDIGNEIADALATADTKKLQTILSKYKIELL